MQNTVAVQSLLKPYGGRIINAHYITCMRLRNYGFIDNLTRALEGGGGQILPSPDIFR